MYSEMPRALQNKPRNKAESVGRILTEALSLLGVCGADFAV